MNELDARRQLLADPRHLTPELSDAIAERPALGALRDDLLDLDERVQAALTEAPLPHGLADRMVLGARYSGAPKVRLAIAAAVAAMAITVSWHYVQPPSDEVAMLDHVRESVEELRDNRGVSQGIARASLSELGVGLADASYRIRHLGRCVVAGRQGRHFTIDGPEGVVSFMVLPASRGEVVTDSLRKGDTVAVYERRGDVLLGAFTSAPMEGAALRKLMKHVLT
jgi:hypothetical protein